MYLTDIPNYLIFIFLLVINTAKTLTELNDSRLSNKMWHETERNR